MERMERLAPVFCINCRKRVEMTLGEEFAERMAEIFGVENVLTDPASIREKLANTSAAALCQMMHKHAP